MIHKYKMNDFFIVLDVNSGAVHSVDECVYDLLDFYEELNVDNIILKLGKKYCEEEIREAYDEITELKNQKLLFSPDSYEELLSAVNERKPVVKALCLHVAHDCNLRCRYCFAQEGEYHGKRSLMSIETAEKAIDFIIENSGKRRNLEIDFFGGEPLINFDVVKETIKYAKSIEKKYNKSFRFTITTNGVLLNDDIQNFINENMNNVVLSIDGRKEINDNMRIRADGSGSYDLILNKFIKLAESRNQNNYYVRGTFTALNKDFYEDVIHLADIGFRQISIEPVVTDKEEYSLKKEDLPYLFEQYERLAAEILKRDKDGRHFNFFHFMIDLEGGPCVTKRLVGCGSGTEYLAVAPEGELYPCHRFVGIEEFNMGSVYDKLEKEELRKKFESCNVYTKPECRKCWAKFYCSGGCAANSYEAHGDFVTPYEIGCELQKKRIECAVMIKAAQSS